MTPSELKAKFLAKHPNSHFFSRKTMRFFGDKMANFGVRTNWRDGQKVYELYRKRPVKFGLNSSYFFTMDFNKHF